MVIATQNPEEHYGTYPLPESQLDRFLLRIHLDYPGPEAEKNLLLGDTGNSHGSLNRLGPVLSKSEVLALQAAAEGIHISDVLAEYMVQVAVESRKSRFLALGISPAAFSRGAMSPGPVLWPRAVLT